MTEVMVSTEHKMIAEIAMSFGAAIPYLRPPELATDSAALIDVIRDAHAHFKADGRNFGGVLCLQPTAPFISSQTIDEAIDLLSETGCDSITTVAEITQGHPYIAKRLETQNVITNFCDPPPGADISSRQSREAAYFLTGGFYLRQSSLVEDPAAQGHALGEDSRAVCVSEIEATDINTELDFRFAEFLLQEGLVP